MNKEKEEESVEEQTLAGAAVTGHLTAEGLMGMLRPMSPHARVSALRELFNLSQVALAKLVGVTRQTVLAWESKPGESPKAHGPGPAQRHALAKVFGVPAFVFTQDFNMENFNEVDDPYIQKKREGLPRRQKGRKRGPPLVYPRGEPLEPWEREEDSALPKPPKPEPKPEPAPGVIRIG